MANYQFLGEYEVKVDTKNRIALPAALRKQLDGIDQFVISRALDHCLNFYPIDAWRDVEAELNKLNPFIKKERDFARFVRGGATEVSLDGQGRILLPKRLMNYAEISGEMIILGNGTLFEMWDLAIYEESLSIDPEDFSALAEEVMYSEPEKESAPVDPAIVVPMVRR
ncbi:division/cell wall cluster transcriptional repressor MraZ [Ignatzschineria ureiclastica]|uniref:Transcriptional regulator MraZ n=1 Tax=Ignatzschineria ureiclastica TaxID=472582 RepID=A0A2U2ADV8_9GAMM|nr:division/cell wall cluster transcriptional repressor MraZ [Ignatzschineria ureiclastica]PWD80840.1 division/cell wall cluster transcriptional repressor MraZ [Ignatzschineria ureiclastica]GGZ94410.1 transcriptional regulator MraZ [Ignatzschineria ureiclastica]